VDGRLTTDEVDSSRTSQQRLLGAGTLHIPPLEVEMQEGCNDGEWEDSHRHRRNRHHGKGE